MEQALPPLISDYGYIGDCHSTALISKHGSIDWCCMPRIDSASCFARLLSWETGGYCQISPIQPYTVKRSYIENTMILETRFIVDSHEARLLDFFTMREGGAHTPYQQILRIIEGISGEVELTVDIVPRFDYGTLKPWIRQYKRNSYTAMGGSHGLLISGNVRLMLQDRHKLSTSLIITAGKRRYLSIIYQPPEVLDAYLVEVPGIDELEYRFTQTRAWWCKWITQGKIDQSLPYAPMIYRSALVLKCLSNAPTGAIAAAPTTSLPESLGSSRNWDYRYSWIRDAYFSVRILASIGFVHEADGFRHFIERSSCSSAEGVQTVFGVFGKRRLHEYIIEQLSGYYDSKPVRVGNAAESQLQLDVYGLLLDMAWHSQQQGNPPSENYWSFLVEIIEFVIQNWHKPDYGIWEIRTTPRHFVHSKVMCWVALDRGIRLAQALNMTVPLKDWQETQQLIYKTILEKGYDKQRKIFIQAFDWPQMDAALLILPMVEFIDYNDPRMLRTIDAIWDHLQDHGLLRRYPNYTDGLESKEGVFLPCTFWIVICLVHQGRMEKAQAIFERAIATANELGLFSEEYDPESNKMLGNFPQALTHLSMMAAAFRLNYPQTDTHYFRGFLGH